jgi:hypothetical protein
MAKRKTAKIGSALQRKGFQKEETHHTYYYFIYNGKKTEIYTYLSHGKKDISPYLRSKMANQLKIKPEEFDKLIDCTMSEDDLIIQYNERGLLDE